MGRVILIIALCGALTACGKPAPIEVGPSSLPATLMNCKDAPQKPAGDYTQRDVGVYIVGLHEAHADCKTRLDAVRKAITVK